MACDAYGAGICGVLSQEAQLVAYISEKLNKAKHKYSIYNKKFYVVMQGPASLVTFSSPRIYLVL